MAILFRCSCGKQLRAQEELRGRRIKCPACTQVVAVPAAPTEEGIAATLPPVSLLHVTCSCGKRLQAAAHLAGKSVRCPGCGQPVRIPNAASSQPTITRELEEDLPVLQKRKPAMEIDEDEEEDEEDIKPRRKKARRRSEERPLWPWIAGAACLVVLVGLGLWLFVFRGKDDAKPGPAVVQGGPQTPAAELDFVPADAMAFYSFRVGAWWESEEGKDLRQAAAAYHIEEMIEKALGVAPRDIQRVIFVMTAFDNIHLVFATSKPYDQAKVLAAMAPGGGAQLVNGKDIHVAPNGITSIYFAGPQLYLIGTAPGLKNLLQQPVSRNGMLSEALRLAEEHLQVVAVNLTAPALRLVFDPKAPPPAALPFLPLLEAQTIVMTSDLGEEFDLRLHFADETAAKKAEDCVKPLLNMIEQQIPGFIKNSLPGMEKEAKKNSNMIISMLHSVSVDTDRNVVHLHLRMPRGSLKESIDEIGRMMEQLQGGAPKGQGRRISGSKPPAPQRIRQR